MARLNEILVGRFNRAYQKAFGIKGGPPVATLAPEIMPVHQIFHGIEDRFTESWTRWCLLMNLAGAGGQQCGVQVRNPPNSNVVGVIERVSLNSTTAQSFDIMLPNTTTDLTAFPSTNSLDARQKTQSAALIVSQQTTSFALVNVIDLISVTANNSVFMIQTENQEVPVLPGSAFQIETTALASQMFGAIWWRERYLEEGERT